MKTKSELQRRIRKEKTLLLYKENQQGLFMSLLVATLVCGVLIFQVGFVRPLIWWLCAAFVLLARMMLYVRFHTAAEQLTERMIDTWHRHFVTGALAYGCVWGLGAPYFAGQLSFEVMLLVVMVMISLCVGAVPYLFYSMVAVEGYLIVIIGPITLWLFWQGAYNFYLAGLTCLVFAVSTYLMARKLNMWMSNTLRLQLENSALSTELIRANQELKQLSSTDPLSGISNRRAFEKAFENLLAQAQREDQSVAVLMLDLDYFKRFNDENGHLAGDELIRTVAQTIQSQLKRPADLVARYGGEEYIVALPVTDAGGGAKVGEDIRAAVEALDISAYATATAGVSISVGVTAIPARQAEALQDFVRYADRALYQAKAEGRNCVRQQLPDIA